MKLIFRNGAFLVIDVVAFNRGRTNLDRVAIREQLRAIKRAVLTRLAPRERSQTLIGGTGDGELFVFPSTLDFGRLLQEILPLIEQHLVRHNRNASAGETIVLRAAIHCGRYAEERSDDTRVEGASGKDINHAFRLLESDELRHAARRLTRAEAPVALLISDTYYRDIVEQELPRFADRFSPVTLKTKEGHTSGYLRQSVKLAKVRSKRWLDGYESHAGTVGANDAPVYHAEFPRAKLGTAIRAAQREILILQTWISDWNLFCQDFLKALRAESPARMSSRLSIRIILIDPDSDACELRGVHSGGVPKEAARHAREVIAQFRKLQADHALTNAQFEVRLSRELPTFAMYRADSTTFLTPYLRQRNTYQSPAFEFAGDDCGCPVELRKHFDQLWETLAPKADSRARMRKTGSRTAA